MLLVLCLEGVHGAGKSELTRLFAADGFEVLDEGFLDMPDYAIHPQSLLMETTWVCSWFSRVLQRAKAARKAGRPQVVIADRSPFSAILYARGGGALLEPVIRAHVAEVSREAAVHVTTAYLRVEADPLWDRICARLAREPHRARYNEGDRAWMDKALGFYEDFRWDLVVHNDRSLEDLLHNTKRLTALAFPEFAHLLHPDSVPSHPAAAAGGRSTSPPLPVAHALVSDAVHTPVLAKHRREAAALVSPALSLGRADDEDDFVVPPPAASPPDDLLRRSASLPSLCSPDPQRDSRVADADDSRAAAGADALAMAE